MDKYKKMVYIIKPQKNSKRYKIYDKNDIINNIIEKIAKQMINMEQGRMIYKLDNSKNDNKEKFNTYENEGIIYDISFYYGILVLFLDNDISDKIYSDSYFMRHLKYKLENLTTKKMTDKYYPFSSKTTHYTAIYSTVKNTNYRKLEIATQPYQITSKRDNYRYTWYIIFKTSYSNSNYTIMIHELNNNNMENMYLFNSLNTIIYDGYDIYNVSDGHKQIDYPYLYQYKMNKQGRLSDIRIHYNKANTIKNELFYIFTGNLLQLITESNKKYHIKEIGEIEYLITDRRDGWIKEWKNMKYRKFKKTKDDKEYRCFISGMPLYDYGMVIGFYKETQVRYILISPILFDSYDSRIKYESTSFKNKFEKYTGLIIIEIFKINIPRTMNDLLEMKEIKELSKDKQEILSVLIKKKGSYERKGRYTMYEFKDEKNNKTLIGINLIDDKMIYKYNKSKNIKIFKICNRLNGCDHITNKLY